MFEMDHGEGASTAYSRYPKQRALKFSAFSHRSFVSIITGVWWVTKKPLRGSMPVIRTPKKGVELISPPSWHIRRSRPVVWKRPA